MRNGNGRNPPIAAFFPSQLTQNFIKRSHFVAFLKKELSCLNKVPLRLRERFPGSRKIQCRSVCHKLPLFLKENNR